MEEKIIVASFTKNKLAKNVMLASVGMLCLGIIIALITYLFGSDNPGYYYNGDINVRPWRNIYDSFVDFLIMCFMYTGSLSIAEAAPVYAIYTGILGMLIGLFITWQMGKCTLTVTNRRVTGNASFGKFIDLPLTQISTVALGAFSRISVATSSGQLHFWFVENREEIYSALTELVGKAQFEDVNRTSNSTSVSNADELGKYKDLLDKGIISQEEFDAKKKKILDL